MYFNMNDEKKESSTKSHKWLRRSLIWVVSAIILCVLIIVICNIIVISTVDGKIYSNIQEIPYRKVGLLLGTSPKLANGNSNVYYENRINAAVELYTAHKISYFLISGDNHRLNYNEPEDMRQSLIESGVPDSVIFLDYAGFRTYDSMIRAKKVFGQDSVTVISQQWHNERAVYIASHIDLDAIAFNASDVSVRKAYIRNHIREYVAKVKAIFDVIFGTNPRYLGEHVSIPGSQSTEYKDSIGELIGA